MTWVASATTQRPSSPSIGSNVPRLVVGPRGKNAKEPEDNFNEARGIVCAKVRVGDELRSKRINIGGFLARFICFNLVKRSSFANEVRYGRLLQAIRILVGWLRTRKLPRGQVRSVSLRSTQATATNHIPASAWVENLHLPLHKCVPGL